MKSFARIALQAVLSATVLLAAAPAQPPKDKDKAKAAPQDSRPAEEKAEAASRIVERIDDAYKLMELGRERKLPEALVGAGRLFLLLEEDARVQPLETVPEVQTEDGKPAAGAKAEVAKGQSFKALAAECFEAADILANEQGVGRQVTALIEAVKAQPRPKGERGAVGGPKAVARVIGPKQQHVYVIDFVAGLPGAIAFQAAPALRCKMVTQNNGFVHFNQVVNVGKYTWTPKDANNLARRFVITVTNPHNAAAQYRLFTN